MGRQWLINALTGKVEASTQVTGSPTYQASGSHFLGLSFSTRLNSFSFRTFANTLCPIWKASLQDRNESGMYNPERVRDAISKYIPFKAFILLVT